MEIPCFREVVWLLKNLLFKHACDIFLKIRVFSLALKIVLVEGVCDSLISLSVCLIYGIRKENADPTRTISFMFTVFKFCPCGTKITFILLQKKSQ
jgi:hypothetical protein